MSLLIVVCKSCVRPPLYDRNVQLVFSAVVFLISTSNLQFCSYVKQDSTLMEIRKELQERPTAKLVDDLRKKVKILQVHLLVYLKSLSIASCHNIFMLFGCCSMT